MAELATIARPYAEALFKASDATSAPALAGEIQVLASVAGDAQLRAFASNPNVSTDQVLDVIGSVVKAPLSAAAKNLLLLALVNARSGVSDAVVYSAYAIEPAQLADIKVTLEKRFGRKLDPTVVVQPELIGGIRVVVGDEVLDTSVKARLEQMKVALTA